MPVKILLAFLLILMAGITPLFAAENVDNKEEGTIFTLWPLIDYRESPQEGYSNLSVLGPLFKLQRRGAEKELAIRPLYYNSANLREESSHSSYLYPIASSEKSRDTESVQVLKLFQKNYYRKDEKTGQQDTMLFPFYIRGTSEKYGPYTSVFPFYGDLYERFWKDEYHYVMFPIYGWTVKKGTITRNYLYPIFSTIEGEKESGFQVWPLYGQSSKEGVYRKQFAVWPFFMREETGLDTDNPMRKLLVLPFYAAEESPNFSSYHYPWPFFGYSVDRKKKQEERDYFWPFFVTIRGESRNMNRYIPFYSEDKRKNSVKHWYMWPLYSHEKFVTDSFQQERDRVLYFLYSDNEETWTVDGQSRRKVAFWPLFLFRRDVAGTKTFTFPAPVEPLVDREGIDKSWAPLWRLYAQKWNDAGDSAVSFLWNLYWHESRQKDLAFEFFPLLSYRTEKKFTDVTLFKGLIRYQRHNAARSLNFLWLPFGLHWGKPELKTAESTQLQPRSKP